MTWVVVMEANRMENGRVEMLKEYDELAVAGSMGVSNTRALWNIARELSRKNDLLEIEMLCKTAKALRSSAKSSVGDLHYDGYNWAAELACMAHKKICEITGAPKALVDDDDLS